MTHAEFTPEDFGVARASVGDFAGGDGAANASITRSVLEGETGPRRDIALVNAAPALVAAGVADGFLEAMELAGQAVDAGDALAVLERTRALSSELAEASPT